MSSYIDEEDRPDVIAPAGAEAGVVESPELRAFEPLDLGREPFPEDDIPRNTYIGGSEAFDACIGDRFGLWEVKTGRRKPDDLSTSDPVIFGKLFEAVVASEYARRTGKRVRRSNKVLLHPLHPWMGVHLDRIIEGTRGLLEVKTGGLARMEDWGEEGSEDIPVRYFFQVQHAMAVTDREFADIPVLFGGQHFRVYTVKRDEAFIERILAKEWEFWQLVETKEPPELGSPEDAARLWPTSRAGEIQATTEQILAGRKLRRVKDSKARLEAMEKALQLELQVALGDRGDTLMAGKEKLATWKTSKGYHVDAFDVDPSRKFRLYIK